MSQLPTIEVGQDPDDALCLLERQFIIVFCHVKIPSLYILNGHMWISESSFGEAAFTEFFVIASVFIGSAELSRERHSATLAG